MHSFSFDLPLNQDTSTRFYLCTRTYAYHVTVCEKKSLKYMWGALHMSFTCVCVCSWLYTVACSIAEVETGVSSPSRGQRWYSVHEENVSSSNITSRTVVCTVYVDYVQYLYIHMSIRTSMYVAYLHICTYICICNIYVCTYTTVYCLFAYLLICLHTYGCTQMHYVNMPACVHTL